MKVIIFEGCDNTGKSLVIGDLCDKIDEMTGGQAYVRYVHCIAPEGKTNNAKWLNQKRYFTNLVNETIADAESGEFDYVIFDRFMEGEYVWGTLYRDEPKDTVRKFITGLEKKIVKGVGEDNVLYVQLTASPEWIARVDDGKSFSDTVEGKREELGLFKEIFDAAVYRHKHAVESARNGSWRSEFHVLEDALEGFEL